MEGDSSADVDRSENSLKQSHKELEEECHKLKETVDKMVTCLLYFTNLWCLIIFLYKFLCLSKGKYTVKDGEYGPC